MQTKPVITIKQTCPTCHAVNGGACLTTGNRPMRTYHRSRRTKEIPGQYQIYL